MPVPKLRFPYYFDEWKKSTIGETGEFYYGRSCPKWSVTDDATIPCIRYGELYTKFENKIDEVYSYTSIEPTNLRFSKGTEVLIPRVGEDPMDYMHCAWLSLPNVAIGEMISVYNTDNNPLFIALMFNAKLRTEFAKRVEGGSVTNLYYEKLKNIEIFYPTNMEEQQKIADFLSTVDEIIAQSEKEVQNLEQQKKAVMQKIFSQEVRFKREDGTNYSEWEERNLKDVALILMGQSPNGSSINEDKNGIPLIQGKADIWGYGIVPDRYTSTPTKVSEQNDIIMTVRAPVGYVAKLGFSACIGRGVCAIRPRKCIDYIFYVLQFKEYEWKYIEQGSTFTAINSEDVASLNIPFPCLDEQQKIANFLSAFDEAITYAKQELEKWKELKKGLLQQMFV